MDGAPQDPAASARTLVVGAAILARGRVLAARRTAPPATAGRWELPGGKVEAEESPEAALVREVAEELGCRVELLGWLAPEVTIDDRHTLRVAAVRLVEGDPAPVEHDAIRWLGPTELESVDWLPSDRPFLPHLLDWLLGGVGAPA
jgi:8-oxo-dGTP diphosphatase